MGTVAQGNWRGAGDRGILKFRLQEEKGILAVGEEGVVSGAW